MNGEIADAVLGLEAPDQRLLDDELRRPRRHRQQGAPRRQRDPRRVARRRRKAAADERELPLYRYVGGANAHVLPVPMMNVLNGGAHADSNVDVQEFMLVPVGAASFAEALRWGAETYHALKAHAARARPVDRASATRAASRPTSPSNEDALKLLARGDRARRLHSRASEIALALDVAATELFARRRVRRSRARAARYSGRDSPTTSPTCVDRYPIVSIEDGMAEDDWDGWAVLTERLGDRVQLVGDDLFVTNSERLAARHRRAASPTRSSIKVNQIGTLTETLDTVRSATVTATRR